MAGTYIVTLPTTARCTLKEGVDTVVVWAENAADARAIAKASSGGDASDAAWALATPVLAATAADLEGWRLRIKVGDIVDCTVTGAAAATVDTIGDLMVIALNATTPIANAAYATPALEIASIADGIGDEQVTAYFLPPLADTDFGDPRVSIPTFLGAIVDGGVAAAALTLALVPANAKPHMLGRFIAK